MRSRRTERNYAHRTLLEKLGVTAQLRVAVVGAHDTWFVDDLNALLAQMPSATLRGNAFDLIFVRMDCLKDLKSIARARAHVKSNGAIWAVYPKGRAAAPSDAEVRAFALALGLVDNKISAYSETHTATKYVIPIARRTPKP